MPAVRGAGDDAWVAAQIAKRQAYIKRTAELLGLDPDATLQGTSLMSS